MSELSTFTGARAPLRCATLCWGVTSLLLHRFLYECHDGSASGTGYGAPGTVTGASRYDDPHSAIDVCPDCGRCLPAFSVCRRADIFLARLAVWVRRAPTHRVCVWRERFAF